MESVQRRAAVVCTGALRRTSTAKLMNEVGWDSLEVRRKKAKLTLFFNLFKVPAPVYLRGKIVIPLPTSHTTTQSLRNASRVSVASRRLVCHKSSFFPNRAALWNSLDTSITASITLSSFKSEMSGFMPQRVDPTCDRARFFLDACYGRMSRIITQFCFGLESPACWSLHESHYWKSFLSAVQWVSRDPVARVRKFQGKKNIPGMPEFRKSFRGIPFHIPAPPLLKKNFFNMLNDWSLNGVSKSVF